MNPHSPKDKREALEARLTSLLLGELSHQEAAELHRQLVQDAELARLYERLKETMGLVRETMHTPAEQNAEPLESLKLSDERRRTLLAQFRTVVPEELERPKSRVRITILELAIAASIVTIIGALMLPALSKAKSKAQRLSTLNEVSLLQKSVPVSDSAYAKRRAESAARQPLEFIPPPPPPASTPADPANVVGYYAVPTTPNASSDAHKSIVTVQPVASPEAVAYSIKSMPRSVDDDQDAHGGQLTLSTTSSQRGSVIVLPPGGQPVASSANAGSSAGVFQAGIPANHSDTLSESPEVLRRPNAQLGIQQPPVALKFRTWSLENSGDLPQITTVPKPAEGKPDSTHLAWSEESVAGGEKRRDGDTFGLADAKIATTTSSSTSPAAHTIGEFGQGLALDFSKDKVFSDDVTSAEPATSSGKSAGTTLTSGLRPSDASESKTQAGRSSGGQVQPQDNSLESSTFTVEKNVNAPAPPAERVPLLGDMAMLGHAFKSESNVQKSETLDEAAAAALRQAKNSTIAGIAAGDVGGARSKQPRSYDRGASSAPSVANKPTKGAYGNFSWNAALSSQNGATPATSFDVENFNAIVPLSKAHVEAENYFFESSTNSLVAAGHGKIGSNNAQLFAYQNAKEDLEQKKRFSQLLDAKIAGEKNDVDLPKSTMVEIVDRAIPPTQKSSSLWDRLRGDSSRDYTAITHIKAEGDQTDVSGFYDRTVPSYDPYFVQTEIELIQSKPILEKIIKDQKLAETWSKETGKPVTTEEAVAKLKSHLELRPVGKTSLIEIKVRSDNPKEAADLANGIADAYRAARKKNREELSRRGISELEERFKEQQAKIASAQSNVDYLWQNLGVSGAVAGAGPSTLMTGETLRRMESLRIERKAQLDAQLTLLSQLRDLLDKKGHDYRAQAGPTAANDTILSTLLDQLSLAQQKLVSVEKEYSPQHAEVIKARGQLEDLRMQLTNRVDSLLLDLEGKVAANQNLAEIEAEVTPAKPKPAANPLIPQPEIQSADNAFSTFSLNVSDVAFKLAAASLEKGEMPDAGSMRSEEFINAFDYRDPEPQAGVAVAFASERAQYPFAQNRDLLRFSVKTAALGRTPGKPLNLVLLLDNSGSMERADRVQIIREALRVLAGQLQPQDKLSIVTFARTAQLRIDGVPGNQATNAVDQVGNLTPEGGTNLEEAMKLAYATALRHYLASGVNRVVLLTDGAANLGDVSPASLKQQVESHRKQGVALDCFGIGWEGYNDDLLEELSRNGDGRYGFINTPAEAATEFAGQLAGALHVAASDVKVQVEFNPKRVTSWRQIGYAKHQLTKEQFRDNTVDAAEIAAAESGNALYVIEVNPKGEGPIATVRARYKIPGTEDYREQEWPVAYNGNALPLDQSSSAMRLAATASAFSEWLAASPYAGEITPDRLLGYLNGVPDKYGADQRPKKLEWMIRQAKSLVGK